MYAVIRAGGKQYRVAPGDVIRVENHHHRTIDRPDPGGYQPERLSVH